MGEPQEPARVAPFPLFILIAIYTGARHGAILGLRWTQTDFISGRSDFNEPGRPQTNKQRSAIRLPRGLRLALMRAQQNATSPWVITFEGRRIKNNAQGIRHHLSTRRP
jgi:integrase